MPKESLHFKETKLFNDNFHQGKGTLVAVTLSQNKITLKSKYCGFLSNAPGCDSSQRLVVNATD